MMNDCHRKKIHCIGIGGIGISALARHYLHEGWEVSGSDQNRSQNTEKLAAAGATIFYAHDPAIISDRQPDMVVYSDGVTKETAGWGELEAARAAGIETLSYFEALARVANEYHLIAVAGTHGKTTTTAMLADILEEASYDPTVFVGSMRTKTGSNYRPGRSKYCVVEADEYLRHFLYFEPEVLVINNIDLDHPDYFTDLADVQAAFAELVAKVPADGYIITNTADSHVTPVLRDAQATIIDYRQYIDLDFPLRQPGLHNRQNAAAAAAAASAVGVEKRYLDEALVNFAGTARRFEYKGSVNNAPVYDDYAHNPQKVTAAIAGAREVHPDKKITVVFQAHTYSRTKVLFDEFVSALATADRVLLLPIFAARETDDGSVTSEMLRDALLAVGVETKLFYTIDAVAQAVRETVASDDVVLCVGAGSVTKVGELLTNR